MVTLQRILCFLLWLHEVVESRDKESVRLELSKSKPWSITQNIRWNAELLRLHDLSAAELSEICKNTLPNTWQTTLNLLSGDNSTYVITGDIDAMWIRDSTEQVMPYFALLSRYRENGDVEKLQFIERALVGVSRRQAKYIVYNQWSNAFRKEEYCFDDKNHKLRLQKWGYIETPDHDLDSGGFFLKLLWENMEQFGEYIVREQVIHDAVHQLMEMWRIEQHHDALSSYHHHKGPSPFKSLNFSGMIWTSNRPSDDRCKNHYHIPDNLFIHHVLQYVAYFAEFIWSDEELLHQAATLRMDIMSGVEKYGVFEHEVFGEIYLYETSGIQYAEGQLGYDKSRVSGNLAKGIHGAGYTLYDDANMPSLLGIPLISNEFDHRIYKNTRNFVLSFFNDYFFGNEGVHGIGSMHTEKGAIWPLALVTQGFTTQNADYSGFTSDRPENDKARSLKWNMKPDDAAVQKDKEYDYERYEMLRMLMKNTAGKGLMHESFHPQNHGAKFSRSWFAWANSYFSQFANCEGQWLDDQFVDNMVLRKMEEVESTENGLIGSEENLKDLPMPKIIGNVPKCHMGNYRQQKSNRANAYFLNDDSVDKMNSPASLRKHR